MRNIIFTNVGKISLSDRKAFKFYRENAKHREISVTRTLPDYCGIIKAFYGKIAEALIENEGGVFIDNLGYFANVMHPKKQIVRVQYQDSREFYNYKTDNHLYSPMFFGVVKYNPLFNFWIMDRAFNRHTVKEKLHKALMSGKKYKNHVSTFYSLYILRNPKQPK